MDLFSISQLSRYSGIKPHTIRIWEQRYDALKPTRSEGNTRYYDIDGKLLLELEGMAFSNFKHGLALVRINDDACFINKKGEIIIKLERPELTYFTFSDGLAEVVIPGTNHKSGFVDKTGKIVIPIQYDLVNDFKDGLAAFRDSVGRWGFIDKEGNRIGLYSVPQM